MEDALGRDVVLRKPSAKYAEQIREYKSSFSPHFDRLHGARGLADCDDPMEWLDLVKKYESDPELIAKSENSSQFIYVRTSDGKIVGMACVRAEPTEDKYSFGGHISYSVAPKERMRGYATRMLHDILPYCHDEMGISKAIISLDTKDFGSIKVVVANGGEFKQFRSSHKHHVLVSEYWIDLSWMG